jgi:hypothetical protein
MSTTSRAPEKAANSSIAEHVAALRDLAERDPLTAQDFAWAWFERLGKLAKHDHDPADLAELFGCGRPSRGIDGPTEGIPVWWRIHPVVDVLIDGMLVVHDPWVGKRLDAERATGINIFSNFMRWPLKLIWPSYRTRAEDGHRLGFEFQTRVEPGGMEPSIDVLVIDYGPVHTNPGMTRRVRDELVEIVEGAHFGRALMRQHDGDGYRNIAYFALKSQLT